jgi:hypothetical protein
VNYLIKPLINPNRRVGSIIGGNDTENGEEMEEKEIDVVPKSNLGFWRRALIKLYGLTYLLEFILICRFMVDIFIHTSYNIFNINYTWEFSNSKTFGHSCYLLANLLASIFMLSILTYEICRFIRQNSEFSQNDDSELQELIKNKIYERLKEKADSPLLKRSKTRKNSKSAKKQKSKNLSNGEDGEKSGADDGDDEEDPVYHQTMEATENLEKEAETNDDDEI